MKYLTNWYAGAVKKTPSMVDNYEKQSEEYVEKNVKNQKLDKTFAGLKTGSKAAFFESLKMFRSNNLQESQNEDLKVFHRDSLELFQLSKNREILMDKMKHTLVQSATNGIK